MPSLSSNKNKWSLLPYPPTEATICIPVTIPNDPRWIGLFLGQIYQLSQQIWYDRDTNHTAKDIAAVWQTIYLETVNKLWDCEGIELFDIRVDPEDECSIQKTLDGVVWTEVFRLDTNCSLTKLRRNPSTGLYEYQLEDLTFYTVPDGPFVPNAPIWYPEPREITISEDVARCNAAYAAARVLQAFYRETWGQFINFANRGAFLVAREFADMASELLGALGLVDEYINIAEELYEEESGFVDGGFPDTLIEDVQNILYCRASVVDDRVVFDHAGVVTDFQTENVTPYIGMAFLLQIWLDSDGLNAAGNIDAGEGDCSAANCEGTCLTLDFRASNEGFGAFATASGEGTYYSGNGWGDEYVPASNARILYVGRIFGETYNATHIEVEYDLQYGATTDSIVRDIYFNVGAGGTEVVTLPSPAGDNLTYSADISSSFDRLRIFVVPGNAPGSGGPDPGGYVRIHEIRLYC